MFAIRFLALGIEHPRLEQRGCFRAVQILSVPTGRVGDEPRLLGDNFGFFTLDQAIAPSIPPNILR